MPRRAATTSSTQERKRSEALSMHLVRVVSIVRFVHVVSTVRTVSTLTMIAE